MQIEIPENQINSLRYALHLIDHKLRREVHSCDSKTVFEAFQNEQNIDAVIAITNVLKQTE